MIEEDTFAIQLTTPELIYFGRVLSLPGLPPEDDPAAPNEAALVAAAESLSARDFIRLPDGSDASGLSLDQTVAAMVAVFGLPQFGLEVQTFVGEQVEPELMQFAGLEGLVVEQARGEGDTYTLTACRTREVALRRLLAFVGLKKQPPAHNESFRLAAEDMAQVPYLIAGGGAEDGAAFLREKGVSKKSANRLAAALENPVRQSMISAAVWLDGEPREIGRLTLLEELYGLWLIAPAGGDGQELLVSPVGHVEAAEAIRELAFQIMPSNEA